MIGYVVVTVAALLFLGASAFLGWVAKQVARSFA